MLRLAYPGDSPNDDRVYSGALAPSVRRGWSMPSVGGGRDRLPLFRRSLYQLPQQSFTFVWDNLTGPEADDIVRQWTDASRGALHLFYTPDDQTEPIRLLITSAPLVVRRGKLAAVQAEAVEQR